MRYALGIDMGGTKLLAGVIDLQRGKILSTAKRKSRVEQGPDELMSRLFDVADEAIEAAKGVKPEAANPVNRALTRGYRPVIEFVLRHRWPTMIVAGVLLVVTWLPWSRIGSEFMPPLNEGSIMDMPSLFPGVGTAQAKQILQQRDAALARIPEVQTVMGKIGRAESATDMAPLSMIETIAVLKDRKDWRPGVSYDSIVTEANNTVTTPGVANMWSMPIKNRLDMLATGIKTPVGIKIFGPNLDTLDRIGQQIEGALPPVRGTGPLNTSDAADDPHRVNIGRSRNIKNKNKI